MFEVGVGEACVYGHGCTVEPCGLHHHAMVQQGIGQAEVLHGLALVEF